ncbi:uncharacterized protein LOC129741446 [Uranotaenia lowii]|uniref:uncharacterized protein LOC129741446 n=1 Tax=Uranotaenia lowii TaxID=190385 RepID=UPI0024791523|nr:uncharacterized protein LOC129741446 [Uranotaenia lowii]
MIVDHHLQVEHPTFHLLDRYCEANLNVACRLPQTEAVQIRCTHRDDFLYAVPSSGCSTYYRCYHRQPIRYKCGDGAYFDYRQQKCVRNEGTCYDLLCTGKTDGAYADTTQACRRFYECSGGNLVKVDNCPLGTLFDGIECAPRQEVTCASPVDEAIGIPIPSDDRCYGRGDGFHVLEDDQCQKVLVCGDSSVVEVLECPEGYAYDERMKRCVFSSGLGLPGCASNTMDESDDICAALPEGLYLDPLSKNCKSYVKCKDGRKMARMDCSKGTVFNGAQCVPEFLYHCPRMALPGDICDKKNDGLYNDPRKGCSYFVKCENFKTVDSFSCPSGFIFDPVQNVCTEDPGNDFCQEVGYSNDCSLRSAGFYQDFSDQSKCSNFFYCFNGFKTILRCPANQVFDGENCVQSSSYSCPSENSDSCANKANGFYRDFSGSCRSYFQCSEGSKTSYLCKPGLIFIGGQCSDRQEDTICEDDIMCSGKSDGYHQDLQSACRSYYYCQGGERLQTLTCRGSKIYNGHSCVSQDVYKCPVGSAASNPYLNCLPRKCNPSCSKSGFETDYDSGCQNYFFCIDTKKTLLSCSSNYIFNGEICVPTSMYNCPKYCDDTVECS